MNGVWIECDDALPNKDGVYLVTLNYSTTDICEYYTNKKQFGLEGNICDEVVAWMPLPKPYRKDED